MPFSGDKWLVMGAKGCLQLASPSFRWRSQRDHRRKSEEVTWSNVMVVKQLVTADELWTMPEVPGKRFELVAGSCARCRAQERCIR